MSVHTNTPSHSQKLDFGDKSERLDRMREHLGRSCLLVKKAIIDKNTSKTFF